METVRYAVYLEEKFLIVRIEVFPERDGNHFVDDKLNHMHDGSPNEGLP